MQIITKKAENKPLTITVEYPELDTFTKDLIKRIRQLDSYLIGKAEGQQTRIYFPSIYYVESVDRRTYVYTESEVFQTDGTLRELEKRFENAGIVRVSKSCFININMLHDIRQLRNSHLEATLINGEKIIVSRTYLSNIKKAFKEGRS